MRSRSLLHASLLLAASSLAACGARTDVSATSNVTAQYSHVWVTIKDIKFNTSATAAAGDSSWLDFPLSTPVTVDLATVTNGALAVFGSALKIPTGTYAQLQLLLTDTSAPLAASAQAAGLLFNDQVQYLDSTGAATSAPLELVHPEQGILLSVSLKIPDNTKAALQALNAGGATTGSTGTSATTGLTAGVTATGTTTSAPTGTCATTTTNTPTTTTTSTTPVTTTANTCTATVTPATFAVGIDFDAERDLVPFTFSSKPGFLLNPHLVAYDLSTAGTIQGQVDISALTAAAASTVTASGNPDIEVSAETLSGDGTRHVVVKSTPMLSNGSFVLYPLTTDAASAGATTSTIYDLVIHGPLIDTVIIKAVPPSVGAPAAATSAALSTVVLASAPAAYHVNVATTTPFTNAGALVQFYQTVPVSGEVPYVVAQQPIDPFNRGFAGDAVLSTGPIVLTTYSGGVTSTATSEPPHEGSGTYLVAAIAPNFNPGALGTKVAAPNPITTTAVRVNPASLTAITGATTSSLSVTTAVAAPGKYNNGELILSQNGAIIAVMPLGATLDQSSGSVTLSGVPGGTSSQALATGLYDLSAWVWSSSNPSGTLSRQSSPKSVDLRSGKATGVTISIE
jgi:uncharacterized protein DUF4382